MHMYIHKYKWTNLFQFLYYMCVFVCEFKYVYIQMKPQQTQAANTQKKVNKPHTSRGTPHRCCRGYTTPEL